MYAEIDFRLSPEASQQLFRGGEPTGVLIRKLLSRLDEVHDLGLPSWFFGYNENGQADGACSHRVYMGRNMDPLSFRIGGIGVQACDLLRSKGALIQSAMIRETKSLVQAHLRSGEHQVDVNSFPRSYHIRRLVVGKTHPDSFWWKSANAVNAGACWKDVGAQALSDLIADGLFDQFVMLTNEGDEVYGAHAQRLQYKLDGLATSGLDERPRQILLAKKGFRTALGVKVVAVSGHTVHRSSGPQGLRVMLKSVEFTMHADLAGPWQIGRNRIESMGLIRRSARVVGSCSAGDIADDVARQSDQAEGMTVGGCA